MLCTLHIHGPNFSKEDVLINPAKFETAVAGSLVSIQRVLDDVGDKQHQQQHQQYQQYQQHHQPDFRSPTDDRHANSIVLRLGSLTDTLRGQAFVSVQQSIALEVGLRAWQKVSVSFVDSDDVALDFVDLSVCSRSASPADLWILRQHSLVNTCVCTGRRINALGFEAHATAMLRGEATVCVCLAASCRHRLVACCCLRRLLTLLAPSPAPRRLPPLSSLASDPLSLDRLPVLGSSPHSGAYAFDSQFAS
jgi:hypothetical protein